MKSAHPYSFGISQEDERSEATALDIGDGISGARVLSVCSAGEMPLCLLALGADSVDAVDIDAGQLHLAWLKRAAVLQLERIPAIRFLGYMPAPGAQRLSALARVSRELPPDSRRFWDERRQLVQHGAIWAGRFEHYVRRLVRLLRPLADRRVDRLLCCASLEEQRACFAGTLDRPWLRAAFEFAFHPRVFARRGMDPRALQHRRLGISLGHQYFEQFRTLCTATPIRENHLLQLLLLGRLLSSEQLPAYLTRRGFAVVRQHTSRLRLRRIDLHQALRLASVGTYNRFHLSNIADWMNAEDFATTLRLVLERSARPARVVWRFIHVDRPVPEDLAPTLRVDHSLRRQLEQRDRFPFYGIVPALIEAAP